MPEGFVFAGRFRIERILGPYGMCLFCFILAGPLAWSSTYPESMIGAGQNLVAAAPVFALLMATRVRPAVPDRLAG